MGNKNKLPNVFNVQQLIKLFDEINDPKTAIASAVSFYCGLRINEVCSLRLRDIDFEKRRLKVTDSKYTRRSITGYGKDRYVPLPEQIISPMRKWIDIIGGGEWFLPSNQSPDRPLRKKTLYENFHFFLKKAGLVVLSYTMLVTKGKDKGVTKNRYLYYFHTLRHSYATYLLERGVDIMTIAELLGHNQVTTTQIYAKVSSVQKSKAVEDAFSAPLMEFKPNYLQPKSQDLVTANQIELERMKLEIMNKQLELKKLELLKENTIIQVQRV